MFFNKSTTRKDMVFFPATRRFNVATGFLGWKTPSAVRRGRRNRKTTTRVKCKQTTLIFRWGAKCPIHAFRIKLGCTFFPRNTLYNYNLSSILELAPLFTTRKNIYEISSKKAADLLAPHFESSASSSSSIHMRLRPKTSVFTTSTWEPASNG